MKELEYPFDAGEIIKKKKSYLKALKTDGAKRTPVRIAVLGGYTTADIKLVTEFFLLNQGLEPSFYESEYNQYYQDAMFPGKALEDFAPEIIYVCTCNRNVTSYPQISDSADQVDALLNAESERLRGMWDSLFEKFGCPVIQNNFEMPSFRLMGNREAYDIHGRVNFLTRLNECVNEYARAHDNFHVCDVNYISADYGLKAWQDPFYWYMYKYAVAVPAIPYLAFNVSNIIKAIMGKNKKGFVLDLDNTLWGGVIGDDGAEGIVLGPEEAEGQAYLDFQNYLKAHKQLGIILNIDSKNDYENAVAGINHPDSAFKEDDFISIKANWDPKDLNFKEIAGELSLLPESLVFVDDNPAERHIVTEQIPGVSAPEISEVTHYIETLDRSGFFETVSISADDLKRNEMYKENVQRARLEASFADYGQYLDSLQMEAEIKPFAPVYMARVAQLSNKSNQFNLTTKRYTQAEIEKTSRDPSYITLYGKLIDRFGDNGVVSVVIGRADDGVCHMELWLMSCRVLKRDMELAMMDALAHEALRRGVREIRGYYYPTAKNNMVREFYKELGFSKISEDEQGNTVWSLDLTGGYEDKNTHIKPAEG